MRERKTERSEDRGLTLRLLATVTSQHSSTRQGLTLVLGGARSGKSRYAESLLNALPPPRIYIATAQPLDDEMIARIATHRERRDGDWHTLEAPDDLVAPLAAVPMYAAMLIDCMTLWLSNRMLADADIDAEIVSLENALARRNGVTVLVSNEVGSGVIPENALARQFRDLQGRLNQRLAARADRVVLLVAGLPMFVKGSP